MGNYERSDDNNDAHSGASQHRSSPNYDRSTRPTQQTDTQRSRVGSFAAGDSRQMEGLREAVVRSNGSSNDWRDWPIIAGAVLLTLCLIATLLLALSINRRANIVIENQTEGARRGVVIVERIEGKIDTLLNR